MAEVIENAQRDLNIALINELALIFDRFGIDMLEVLKEAGTKWNCLPRRPGPTFKENVPDLCNSKVIDVTRELQSYGAEVIVHDLVADPAEAMHECGLKITP